MIASLEKDYPVKTTEMQENNLFPVFLKLDKLRLLIIGGGPIACEKLTALLNNTNKCSVKIVALNLQPEIKVLASLLEGIELIEGPYSPKYLKNADLVICATNDNVLNIKIREDAKSCGVLINVADCPSLCDFYLSSIVQKGHLKIGISTNGKSPTLAKRLKQVLDENIPAELDPLLENMHQLRKTLKGNFADKVLQLNLLTQDLVKNGGKRSGKSRRYWHKMAYMTLFALFFLLAGSFITRYFLQ